MYPIFHLSICPIVKLFDNQIVAAPVNGGRLWILSVGTPRARTKTGQKVPIRLRIN